ncbi:MAG: hypothetical protein ACI4B5_09000 [Bacteroidaceae bacterium]
MKGTTIFMGLVLAGLTSMAQSSSSSDIGVVCYGGQPVSMCEHTVKVQLVGALQGAMQGTRQESFQGMEVYGDFVLSAQNRGWLTIYNYDGKQFKRIVEPFKMNCFDEVNHSNVVSLSRYRYDESDPLPLLYVSQCARQPWQGKKDVLFVERVAPDLKSTKTVQTICFQDDSHLFGYALQWVIDRENDMLYGYGNTVNNEDAANQHRIVKFRLPKVDDGEDGLVTLTEKDLLENYLVEDTFNRPFMPIGQGLFIRNGQLFMPTGIGSDKHPSILYVWDLKTRTMQNVIDLSRATHGELEDCAAWGNSLLLQTQGNLFRLDF